MLQRRPKLRLQCNAGATAGQGDGSLDQRATSPPAGNIVSTSGAPVLTTTMPMAVRLGHLIDSMAMCPPPRASCSPETGATRSLSPVSFGGSNRLGVEAGCATIAETECIERWHACYHSRAGSVGNLDVPQSQAPCICVACRNENERRWALSQKMPSIAPPVQPPIAPVSGRHHWSGRISRSGLSLPI